MNSSGKTFRQVLIRTNWAGASGKHPEHPYRSYGRSGDNQVEVREGVLDQLRNVEVLVVDDQSILAPDDPVVPDPVRRAS